MGGRSQGGSEQRSPYSPQFIKALNEFEDRMCAALGLEAYAGQGSKADVEGDRKRERSGAGAAASGAGGWLLNRCVCVCVCVWVWVCVFLCFSVCVMFVRQASSDRCRCVSMCVYSCVSVFVLMFVRKASSDRCRCVVVRVPPRATFAWIVYRATGVVSILYPHFEVGHRAARMCLVTAAC